MGETLREQLLAALYRAADEFNEEQPQGHRLVKAEATFLYGEGSGMDSLALVSFLAIAEEELADQFDRPIVLASEQAMSLRNSPFRTLRSLADYALSLIREGPASA